MIESDDGTSRPINTVNPQHVVHPSRIALVGQDHQTQSPSDHFPSIFIDQPLLPHSPSPTDTSLNEVSSMIASVPSAHLFASVAVLPVRDNEPGCVPYSLCTLEGGPGQIPRKLSRSSCREDRSFDLHNYGAHSPSLIENPPSLFQSYNAAPPSSKTEAHRVGSPKTDTHIEDDILKNTIPAVRDVLQGAAKGLDTSVARQHCC